MLKRLDIKCFRELKIIYVYVYNELDQLVHYNYLFV